MSEKFKKAKKTSTKKGGGKGVLGTRAVRNAKKPSSVAKAGNKVKEAGSKAGGWFK